MATAKRRTTGNRGTGSRFGARGATGSGAGGSGGQSGGYKGPGWRGLGPHVLLLAVVAFGVVGVFYKEPVMGYSTTAASYAARTACSCRYVAGREMDQCRTDFEPGMGIVFVSEDEEARSVTARVPLLSSQTARYTAASGCVLEAWEG